MNIGKCVLLNCHFLRVYAQARGISLMGCGVSGTPPRASGLVDFEQELDSIVVAVGFV